MKTFIFTSLTTTLLLVLLPQQSWGQINFGNVLRGELQRGAQQIRGEIQGAIGGRINNGGWQRGNGSHVIDHGGWLNGTGPQHGPYPQHNPQPNIQPYPSGVIHPIGAPTCATPLVSHRQINRQYPNQIVPQPQSFPATQNQPQPQAASQNTEAAEAPLENLPTVFGGQEVAIEGDGFGDQPGSVRIKIGPMILMAKVTSWSDTNVDVVIPEIPLVEPTEALMAVIDSGKQVVQQLAIQLAPAPESNSSDDQAATPQLPSVQMGTELELAGTELGSQPGRVELKIGDASLAASIVEWKDNEVTIRIPELPLADSMPGTIHLILADGSPVSDIPVLFTK